MKADAMRRAAATFTLGPPIRLPVETCGVKPAAGGGVLLPLPPTANHLFRNVPGMGRVRTRAYLRWADVAGLSARAMGVAPVPCRVRLVVGPMHAGRDLDNCIKAVLDLLVAVGVLRDDSVRFVVGVATEYDPSGPEGVRVSLAGGPS